MSTDFDLVEKARGILSAHGLVVDAVDCSGENVRCGTTQDPRGTAGWYRMHMDFPPNLSLINYHDEAGGIKQTFKLYESAEMDAMTEADKEALRERIRQEKKAAQEKRERERKETAERAKSLWATCRYATEENAYLRRKGVLPLGDMRQDVDGRLVLPLLNAEGETVSLQFIGADGEKRFLPGGEKKGCFFPVPAKDGGKSGPLLIGEGAATVLSCCMATGYAGLVAFDAGNLLPVAQMARQKYPGREIIICGDNDCTDKDGKPRPEEKNTGVLCARKAAEAIGARLAAAPALNGRKSDWNDIHNERGLKAVLEGLKQAQAIAAPEEKRQASPLLPMPPRVPLEAFPKEAQELITDAARTFLVPEQIPTTSLLALVSCLVGRSRGLRIKSDWTEYGNVWIVLVASSGVGKTPVMNAFFRHLEQLEYEKYQGWKAAVEQYQREYAEYVRKSKTDGAALPPEKPRRVQYYMDDATLEALAPALMDNPKGIMWRVDEISGLLSSFDRYSPAGKEGGTRARLLSSYDSGAWKISRRSSEKDLFVPHAAVSIYGGLQPDMMRRSFDGADRDSGFLPRFQFIRAEKEGPDDWSEAVLSRKSHELLERITRHLSEFALSKDEQGRELPQIVLLDEGAKVLFVQWFKALALENWEIGDTSAYAIRRKLNGQALRLCLLLHCLDAVLSGNSGLSSIPADTMRRALLLADWVKLNQLQTWRLLTEEKTRRPSPLEQAVVQVFVDEEARLAREDWTMTNEKLVGMVNALMSAKSRPEKVASAAAGLGLAAVQNVGPKRQRGRRITPELLAQFKELAAPRPAPEQPDMVVITEGDSFHFETADVVNFD